MLQPLTKIMYVEDEIINYFLFREWFKGFNIEIVYAKDGLDSIEQYKNNRDIILIFMNILMPRMRGTDACQAIKKIDPQVIIYADTAYTQQHYHECIENYGFDGYISRPPSLKMYHEILMKYVPDFKKM